VDLTKRAVLTEVTALLRVQIPSTVGESWEQLLWQQWRGCDCCGAAESAYFDRGYPVVF